MYMAINESKVCFLILYLDDFFTCTIDKSMFYEVKQFLSKNFDMKDMANASYVIGIKIHKDRCHLLSLSSKEHPTLNNIKTVPTYKFRPKISLYAPPRSYFDQNCTTLELLWLKLLYLRAAWTKAIPTLELF